jgi:pSer/pThr/pTyr-binding forkhead associated (FHA) protein
MNSSDYKLKRLSDNTEIAVLPRMVLGRLDECDLQLAVGGASRRHAVLSIEAGQLWLEDLKSANGTFVNEQRVDGRLQLQSGDHLRIDVEEFLILMPMDSAATIMKKVEPVSPPPIPTPIAQPIPEPGLAPQPEIKQPIASEPKTAVVQAEEKNNPNATLPGAWASGDNVVDGEGRTSFIARKDLQGELESAGLGNSQQIKVNVPTLLIHTGIHSGLRFEMSPDATSRAEWSVGSVPGRSILLTDTGVSALHAVISVEGSRWKLVDKMSANGTFVNGRSAPSTYLSPGDQISFGPVQCAFFAPVAVRREEPQPAQVANKKSTGNNKTLLIAALSFGITLLVLGVFLMIRK